MLGISYGELFLLIGATAALIGPKDLPAIARTAGRLAGRSIGYVQLARGQFENVMQQSQARQVHKELQDTIAQLEAIRYEIRTISFMNPGPMTRRLVDNLDQTSVSNVLGNSEPEKLNEESGLKTANTKVLLSELTHGCYNYFFKESGLKTANTKDSSTTPGSSNMHSQATTYARLAESSSLNSGSMESKEIISELTNESGVTVLPVSAESTGLLPDRRDEAKGSDIVLEAILEAEVARNAKDFFAQPQNQIKCEQ